MNKKWQLNLSIVLPFALWGFSLSTLNFRTLKEMIPAEMQVGIIISFIALNIIYLLYYLILICYLKLKEKGSPNHSKLIIICGIIGTLFTLISFCS